MLGNLQIGSINGVGFMPVNLVINPEFTVNQRGAASRTAATGYNYDRWYYDGSNLLQGIENLNLRATTYVVSWSGSATCSYSLNTAASSSQSGQTFTSITNGGTLTISSLGSNNLWIKFSGTLTDLTNVMVVPSAAQTPFIARQYPQELALCQRYCYATGAVQNGSLIGIGQAYSGTSVIVIIVPPVPMRATPTATRNGLSVWPANVSTDLPVSSITVNPCIPSSIRLDVGVASGLSAGQAAFLQGTSSPGGTGYLILNSEL